MKTVHLKDGTSILDVTSIEFSHKYCCINSDTCSDKEQPIVLISDIKEIN